MNLLKKREQVQTNEPSQQMPLRLIPGIVIAILLVLIRYFTPAFSQNDTITVSSIFGGLICSVAILVWWVFFSRAPLIERLVAPVLMIVALLVTPKFLHVSIATAMMGMMFYFFAIPVIGLAIVAWAVATKRVPNRLRFPTMVVAILLASGSWILIRTNGMTADAHEDFDWRWAKTAEEKLLAQSNSDQATIPTVQAAVKKGANWPGFRGANRDGIIHGVQIETNWSAKPPVEIWHKPVGPGCSSFAAMGNVFFTQEQRGEFETVSCYDLVTCKPIWSHRDKARFYDSHAGAGPRSTPTLSGDYIYTLGGTGILNALKASDGTLVWSRDAATDAGVKVLTWGFSSSPLVIDSIVIVALSGKLAAYNIANGNPLWYGPDGGNSYSSPQLATIGGVQQVILMSMAGAVSVEPKSGKQLWKYDWSAPDRILQPAFISEGEFLLSGETQSLRRVYVSKVQDIWSVKERWNSTEMKLNFNDFIIHKGFAYGFDGPYIACVDIKDGKRTWKGNPYRGWLLLLADQDILIVLTEKGDLALVKATPDKFTELAKIPAIKGKTWNHPALAGDVLLVRNAEEMAAYRLSVKN
jgi:outer membrane protein assembly factor BamB